jgi:hypothetical protein
MEQVMNVAIAYFSILGSSRKYARWLAEDLGADLLHFRALSDARLDRYETVVVLSGTFGTWMPLTKFLKEHWPGLATKHVVVVAVGSIPADDPSSVQNYNSIPEEIRQAITYFKLPCQLSLKLWLAAPVGAYLLSKHRRQTGWIFSREKLEQVSGAVRALERTTPGD